MKKFLKVFLIIAIVAGMGLSTWYVFFKQPVLKVEFYGKADIVKYLSGDGEYEENDTVVLTAEEKPGYDFAFWLKDGKQISNEKTYTFVMSEQTSGRYSAQYNPREFEIFSPNGGVSESTAKTDEIVVVNVAVPKGFYIDEIYYVQETDEEKVDIYNGQFKMPPSNISIVVTIKEIDYKITYDLQGGSFDGNEIETYTINTPTFILPTPKKQGYVFAGYTNESNENPVLEYQIKKGSCEDISVTANWELAPLNIRTEVEGKGRIDVNSVGYFGNTVEFTTTPNAGYSLSEIYYIVDGTSEKVYITENSFVMPNKAITIYVVFAPTQYEVTIVSDHGSVELSKQTPNAGEEVFVNITPDQGYEAKKCYYIIEGNLEEFEFTDSFVMPAENIEIFVVYDLVSYNITYVLNGGTLPETYASTYTILDVQINLPTPTKVGHNFAGWFDNDKFEGVAISFFAGSQAGGKTFYALYTLQQYAVKFLNYDGSEIAVSNFKYGETAVYTGQTPTKPSTAQYNYTFAGWTPTLGVITENTEYTAVFTESLRKYTVIFVSNGGSEVDNREYTYMQELGTLPVTTQTGYTFVGWYTALTSGIKAEEQTIITANITYIAKWTAINYAITYNLDGGSLENKVESYNIETETFELPNPTKTGYDFVGWIVEQTDTPNKNVVIEQGSVGDKEYTAVWEIKKFTVTWKNYDGTVLETDYDVNYNTTPTYDGLTPTKESTLEYDYVFAGWLPSVTDVVEDMEYIAQFTSVAKTYNITLGQVTNGTISCSTTGDYGQTITVTATPSEGYKLTKLYYVKNGETEQIEFENSFTMPSYDVTVYAEFTAILFNINFTDDSLEDVTLSHTKAKKGEIVTIILPEDINLEGKYVEVVITPKEGSAQTISELTFEMPNCEVTIKVAVKNYVYYVFTGTTYFGSISCSNELAYFGEEITVVATPETGFRTTRTYYVKTGSSEQIEFENTFSMPSSSITIYAEFEVIFYTITKAPTTKGSFTCSTSSRYNYEVFVNATPDENYRVFKIYYVKAGTTQQVKFENSFIMPNSDITIYVVFEEITYNVDVVKLGNSVYECSSYYAAGANVQIQIEDPEEFVDYYIVYYIGKQTEERGDVFEGKHNPLDVLFISFIMPKENITLYIECHCTLNYSVSGLDSIDTKPEHALAGETVTIVVTPKENYVFNSASASSPFTIIDLTPTYLENGKVEFSFTMAQDPLDVNINFVLPTFNITKSNTTNGSFTCVTSAKYTSTVTVTATPNAGYEVLKMYYIKAGSTQKVEFENEFTMPLCNVTVYVEFARQTFKINKVEKGPGSSINVNSARAGSNVRLEIDAAADFVNVYYIGNTSQQKVELLSGGDGYINKELSFTMPEENITLYIEYCNEVSYDAIGCTIEGPQLAIPGDEVTILVTFTKDSYYLKQAYYIDHSGEKTYLTHTNPSVGRAEVTFEMPEVAGVYVLIECIDFSYTITKGETASWMWGTFECKDTAVYEEVVTVTVTPNDGYMVARMFYKTDLSNTEVEFTNSFVMPDVNVTVYVIFVEAPKPLYNIELKETVFSVQGVTLSHTQAYEGDIITIILPEDYSVPEGKYLHIEYRYSIGQNVSGGIEFTEEVNGLTFEMPDGYTELYVEFYNIYYNITKAQTTNGSFTLAYSQPFYNKTIKVTATPNTGYEVARMYYIKAGTTQEVEFENEFTMPSGDVTVYVLFETVELYTIEIIVNNIDGATISHTQASEGELITLTLPEDYIVPVGYKVVIEYYYGPGYAMSDSFEDTTFEMPNFNIRLWIGIVICSYDIEFAEVPNGFSILSNWNGFYGDEITIATHPNKGYEVARMYYIKEGTTEKVKFDGTFTMPASNVTVYVEFVKKDYIITKAPTTNGSFDCVSSAKTGENVYVVIHYDEGYELAERYYIKEGTTTKVEFNSFFEMPASNVTVYVEFQEIPPYEITKEITGNGSISCASSAKNGEKIYVTVEPDEGYVCTEIYYMIVFTEDPQPMNEDEDGNLFFTMPICDVKICAKFEKVTAKYSITKVVEGNGTVECVNSAEAGEAVYITVTPDEGYDYTYLYYTNPFTDDREPFSVDEEGNLYFVMPQTGVTIFCVFELIPISYNVSVELCGVAIENVSFPTSAVAGEELTVSVAIGELEEIYSLYYFGKETNTEGGDKITYSGNNTFSSTFTMPEEDIIVYISVSNYVNNYLRYINFSTLTNGGAKCLELADEGTIVNVYTNPDEGYQVARMYYKEDGSDVEVEFDGSFEMVDNDITIYVEFEEIKQEYTITKVNTVNGDFICPTSAEEGSVVLIPVAPEMDFEVLRMYYVISGSSDEVEFENSFVMPKGNITIYVVFERTSTGDQAPEPIYNSVKLYVNYYTLGTAKITKIIARENKYEITATPVAGARFVEWRKDTLDGYIVSTESTITIDMDTGGYIAIFEENETYNISVVLGTEILEVDCVTQAKEGETVIVTIVEINGNSLHGTTPNITISYGYDNVLVRSEKFNDDNTYSFVMPSEDVTIEICFLNVNPS